MKSFSFDSALTGFRQISLDLLFSAENKAPALVLNLCGGLEIGSARWRRGRLGRFFSHGGDGVVHCLLALWRHVAPAISEFIFPEVLA